MAKRYAEADGLRQRLDSCKSMAGLAKDVGSARFEDLKFIKPSTIPEPTRSMLLSAKDGDVLPPATAAAGIEIYAVCGRRALKADEKEREKAQEELSQQGIRDRRPSAICATSGRMRTSNSDERAVTTSPRARSLPAARASARAMPVAVSMGDPAGIGLDIALMSWRQRHAARLAAVRALRAIRTCWRACARARPRRTDRRRSRSLAEAAAAFADALPVWRVPIGAGTAPTRPSSRRSRWRPRPWPRAMRWRW